MKTNSNLPLLLYSYLATEMLAPFFASFIVMNCVFFLVKLIPFLNLTLDLNIGLPDFVRLFTFLFPNIFLYSIPMSAMIGMTIGFARLSSDSEILALKASGISIYQVLPPAIIVAIAISLFTAYFSIKLIPLSEVSMKRLIYQLMTEKINHGIKEHLFTEALGDVVVYVEKIDKTTGRWQEVWVSDMRGVKNPVITMASTGSMKSSSEEMTVSIVLQNGSLHRPGNDNAQIVQFDRYVINIPLLPPDTKGPRSNRSSMSMGELLENAQLETENTEHKRKLLIEYHKRLVLPVGCLMISLIGLPLGLQARPGKKAIGIQIGLVIFILYYILFTFGKTLAEDNVLPIALAMWVPNVFFLLLAIFWIVQVSNEKPLVPEKISSFFGNIWDYVYGFIKRRYDNVRKLFRGSPSPDEETGSSNTLLPEKSTIRGNVRSRVFHLPGCEFYDCKNCTIEFKNINIATDSGFEHCRFCRDNNNE